MTHKWQTECLKMRLIPSDAPHLWPFLVTDDAPTKPPRAILAKGHMNKRRQAEVSVTEIKHLSQESLLVVFSQPAAGEDLNILFSLLRLKHRDPGSTQCLHHRKA